MGTKRTTDSGKRDSLGRVIKVSEKAPEAAAGNKPASLPADDFSAPTSEGSTKASIALDDAADYLDSQGINIRNKHSFRLLQQEVD